MFSGDPSSHAQSVDAIMTFIVISSVILLLGITIAMIYFVIKFNKKRNPVASQISHNTILETLWIAIPTVLVTFMFYYGYVSFREFRIVPKGAINIKVIARQWQWQFEYPNGVKTDTLYLPDNKPVKLTLTTVDVNHGFFVPAFRAKEDIIAGRENYLVLDPAKTGLYDIVCSQYCGLDHSLMHTMLKVIPQKVYFDWQQGDSSHIHDNPSQGNLTASITRHQNIKYLEMKGCLECHSLDGTKMAGPSFTDLAKGITTIMAPNGDKTVKITDDYLKRSITDPNAEIVKGFAKFKMPNKMKIISGVELDSLIAELKGIQK